MSRLDCTRRYGFCDPAVVTFDQNTVQINLVENAFQCEEEQFSFKLNTTYAEHLAREIFKSLGVETL